MSITTMLPQVVQDYLYNLGKAPLVFILTFVVPVLLYLASAREDDDQLHPPKASPSLPLLGNALHYQKNPDVFLVKQAEALGGIFTINLAGLQTTIITAKQAMKQMAFTSERVLSSNAAVADFGFRYTLGDRNVFSGTDVHKRIIKQKYSGKDDLEELSQLYWKCINESIEVEIQSDSVRGKDTIVPDFLNFSRRVILRTMTYEMIGRDVVKFYNSMNDDFISVFMDFQDDVEECTAKAAVCPAWLASLLFLKDCEKKRLNIVSKLAVAIEDALQCDDTDVGRWLLAAHNMKTVDGNKQHTYEDIADFSMGLLFAAHKNASIAAAQSILHALEHDRSNKGDLMKKMTSEAKIMKDGADAGTACMIDLLSQCNVIEKVALETLRVTGHSIGAVRKVIVKEGWAVSVEDDNNPDRPPKKYTLPYGSYVGISHIVPHRDQRRWGMDCASFNPDRESLVERSLDDLDFTNFSHGVHKCPGSKIAIMVIRLFVVIILSKFEVQVFNSMKLPGISFERATLAQRKDACKLLLKEIVE